MLPVYDAIIIGSGLAGLSSSAYLSINNWKVLVIEKHNKPGVYATIFSERAEKIIPEFSTHIEVIEIAAPLTLRKIY
jgi:thioredoxin reductase